MIIINKHISDTKTGFTRNTKNQTFNPCRIVGMLNFDMNTQEGPEAFLKSEKKKSHSSFECFNGSWMCTYPTANIESKK